MDFKGLVKGLAAAGPEAMPGLMRGVTRTLNAAKEIDEAAATLALGKNESVRAAANTALSHIAVAVDSILGETHSVLKRTSKSTGTERLSFVVGEIKTSALREPQEHAIISKAEELLEYLKSKGVKAEAAYLQSDKLGYMHQSVDLILDENILNFTTGKMTATAVRNAVIKSLKKEGHGGI